MFTDSKPRQSWGRILSALIAIVIVWSACVREAQAGERKFIVMLANSPKQFAATGGLPPGGLVDRATVDNAYFEKVAGNALDSFAEYWEEISYGDVTVAGLTTDWISLPWSFQPPAGNSPADFTFLRVGVPASTGLLYGTSEFFDSFQAMVRIDIDGDPNNADNGPFPTNFGPGGADIGKNSGTSVWMPGQRFLDLDGDGRWDGLDEITNQMDHNVDNLPDLSGPWTDLDGNGQPNNIANCVFLPDSDNDGNPDCCPDGPGSLSCGGIMEQDVPTSGRIGVVEACPPSSRAVTVNNQQVTQNDCNGNGIPDPCDVMSMDNPVGFCLTSPECVATGWLDERDGNDNPINPCGGINPFTLESTLSPDKLPFTTQNDACAGTPDGIPDECQFFNWMNSAGTECTTELPTPGATTGCPASGNPLCATRTQTLAPQCEFDDSNDDNAPDVVEPFEAFLRIGNHLAVGASGDPDPGIELDINTTFGRDYITNNYPGHADKVISQSIPRRIWGRHDPLGNTVNCVCADGLSCRILGRCSDSNLFCESVADCPSEETCRFNAAVTGMCPAGQHLAYTSPDRWLESGITTKMVDDNFEVLSSRFTPEPSWYKQAWKDRYPDSIHGSCLPSCAPTCSDNECVPVWNAYRAANPVLAVDESFKTLVPFMTEFQGTQRRYFSANRGGLGGNGLGWTGADNGFVNFTTGEFEDAFNNATILPEETDGIGTTLFIFDGLVEHDDLPSSKYHQGGDQRLGEVTSHSNNSIWGQDLAPNASGGNNRINAAGPYATAVHGNLNTDAGNLLNMELMTWRWEPPFNDGLAWTDQAAFLYRRPFLHPYAGPSRFGGEGLGFRDYNLDGLIDQGEVRPVDSENFLVDSFPGSAGVPGAATAYPWNRQRLLEDCVEALDSIIDFDLFVDSNSLEASRCVGTLETAISPAQYGSRFIDPEGALSGVVLLPAGSQGTLNRFNPPRFYPIHNQDADNAATSLSSALNWSLEFHDFVLELSSNQVPDPNNDLGVIRTADAYLDSWEGYPDLFDHDVFLPSGSGAKINTPVGLWDITASGGLVHPSPILKESVCSRWIEPVDLTTILTPGVDTRLTLPPSEFVRDESHFFLENEDIPGERYYFWSVGSGMNTNMPGTGMLIQHTDVGGNPEALPSGQQNATRFEYLIVQADGLRQLEDGIAPFGDAGDPFGAAEPNNPLRTANNTSFTCETNPASKWYTFNTCTGLSVTDIRVDDVSGSVSAVFNLVPTSIPNLRFLQPAGGATNNSGIFTVRVRVADSVGGTTVRIHFTTDKNDFSISSSNSLCRCVDEACIGDDSICTDCISNDLSCEFKTTTPGTNEFDIDWDVNGLPDGQYFLFAELIPGVGADGRFERTNTSPRAGRNNTGDGSLAINNVNIAGQTARFETWVVEAIDAAGTEWEVNSSLSQPDIGICVDGDDDGAVCDLNTECDSGVCNTDRFEHAFTGVPYTSVNNEVTFTINKGDIDFIKKDTISFSTTGITAPSAPVTIISGIISDGPIAIIDATPLTGKSPLTVSFIGKVVDSQASQGHDFIWDFGDGSATATGSLVTHTYTGAQTFTAILTVTDKQQAFRSGEDRIDIILTNNSPNAEMSASPLDGPTPLTVSFSSVGTSDNESDTSDLVFEWDFGDGETAGTGVPGELTSVNHIYFDEGENNGRFTAALTVTDPGGKSDTVTLDLLVGNTRPVAVITTSSLSGTDPHTVTFDATNSTDADGDDLTVVWTFDVNNPSADNTGECTDTDEDDCTQDLSNIPAGTDGSVTHTYRVPSGQSSATFTATAVLTDSKMASVKTSFNIVVNEAPFGASQPRARFTITPNPPLLGELFTADASESVDSRDPDNVLDSWRWDWGDTNTDSGEIVNHKYDNPGRYLITLTVTSKEPDPESNAQTQIVSVAAADGEDPDNLDPVAIIGTGPRSGSVPLTIEFNGLNSFDPDGDPIEFTWEFKFGDTLVDVLTGPIVTKTFELAGTFTVTLKVSDGRGGLGISGVRVIEVDPRVGAPGTSDPTPGQPPPDGTTAPRRGICGLGMITSMFGSLIGLLGMMVSRRRRFWL